MKIKQGSQLLQGEKAVLSKKLDFAREQMKALQLAQQGRTYQYADQREDQTWCYLTVLTMR